MVAAVNASVDRRRLATIGNPERVIEFDLAQCVAAAPAAMASTSTLERF
jgi:hypothetical protein